MSKRSDLYPLETNAGGPFYPFAEERGKIHLTHSAYTSEVRDHTHGFVEIVCIVEGSGIHIIDGKEYAVHRGDLFLIDCGTRHHFHSNNAELCWINCIFKPENLTSLTADVTDAKKLLLFMCGNNTEHTDVNINLNTNLRIVGEDTVSIFCDMLREYDRKTHGYEKILEHYLWILLEKIVRKLFFTADNTDKTASIMENVLRDLDNAKLDSISAKRLADSYCMSKPTFSENFKKYMGISFKEYVMSLRIKQACRLLAESELSVSEIQTMVGYHDPKSFYRAFRRYTGTTPTEYKKQEFRLKEVYYEKNQL